jgi:hypothetical protein
MLLTYGQASIAFTKEISDLGFASLQGTFSIGRSRPQFDATVLCREGVSLGQILERGLDIISPHFLDDDMMSCLHSGSFNPKGIADVAKDGMPNCTCVSHGANRLSFG